MDTLNERIKILRKDIGLSQSELSQKIGISQRALSWGEQPGNNVPDSTIKAICREFNVNENWLRSGEGAMFAPEPTFSLDRYVQEHGGTDLELEIIKAYFALPKAIRAAVLDQFLTAFTGSVGGAGQSKTPYEMTREQLHAEMDKQLDMEKEAKEKSEVS